MLAHARELQVSRVVTRYIFGQLIPHLGLKILIPDPKIIAKHEP